MNSLWILFVAIPGSTEGVAQYIGKTLSDLGQSVDVFPMKDVTDISNYEAVIAGSAIQVTGFSNLVKFKIKFITNRIIRLE